MTRIGREQEKCVQVDQQALNGAWELLSELEGDIIHTRSAHLILAHLLESLIEDGDVVAKTEGGRLLKLSTDDLDMLMHALYDVQDQINEVMNAYRKGITAFRAARQASA